MRRTDSATPTTCRADRGRFGSAVLGLSILIVAFGATAARAAVNISSAPTKNMSCSAGVCSPTAKKAILNAGDLVAMLRTSDTTVTTGSGAVTIEVTASFSWSSISHLTLDAQCNVSIKAPVTLGNNGGVRIITNDGGSGCDLLFFGGGKIAFADLNSTLLINGSSYVLAGSVQQLAQDIAVNPSGLYALTKDYDASVDGLYSSPPIGTPFTGMFEGLGHAISNFSLMFSGGSDNGLFSQIAAGGLVRDLKLTNVSIGRTANVPSHAGSLAGANDGVIHDVRADGRISTAAGSIGGLVGVNRGTIDGSHLSVSVSANGRKASILVGGLAGDNEGTIVDSSATGETLISATAANFDTHAGGLVGFNSGTIASSFAEGAVSAQGGLAAAGGLAGNNSGVGGSALIVNSYSTGPAKVASRRGGSIALAGGLVGENDYLFDHGGAIQDSFSIGAPKIGRGYSSAYIGGLTGHSTGPIGDSYWDIDTSGQTQSAGGVGLTDAQLKSALPAGFDPAVWGQDPNINNGYPYLLANPPAN